MNSRFKQICSTHRLVEDLSLRNANYSIAVLSHFLDAIKSDLCDIGDLTTMALFGGGGERKSVTGIQACANFVVKEFGVVAGIDELNDFMKFAEGHFLKKSEFIIFKHNGEKVKAGQVLATLKGDAAGILKLERTALNFLQRMSGIATLTRKFVDLVPENVLVVPTRKTFWGALDKAACIAGGAGSHRLNLSDAVLIKDNHLKLMNKDFDKIFEKLARAKKIGKFMEIEVDNLADFKRVLMAYDKHFSTLVSGSASAVPPLYILLDNMKPTQIKKIVEYLKASKFYKTVFLEASGGVNLKNIKKYAQTGVDIISVGALTHSAPALDISMKIV